MVPKKKSRQSTHSIQDEDSVAFETPEPILDASHDNTSRDAWTDEQEISLFKGIMRWKPAGMHKHFRMIALSGYLRNHGYDPTIHTHTQIPGIWKKLGSLYNLDAIDEREDFDGIEDDEIVDRYKEFSLPLDEYGVEMMERGRDLDWRGSPPCQDRPVEDFQSQLPAAVKKRKRESTVTNQRARGSSRIRDSTVEDTDEPRTSPPPPSGRRGRSARGKGDATIREASRGTTVETESTKNEEQIDDEQADDDDEQPEDSEQDDTTTLKGTKGGSQKRGRGVTRSTRKSARKR